MNRHYLNILREGLKTGGHRGLPGSTTRHQVQFNAGGCQWLQQLPDGGQVTLRYGHHYQGDHFG
ncbi:hypothetical protein ES703_22128 [subsurface metagenome]